MTNSVIMVRIHEYFDQVRIVNLPDRDDRRRETLAELKKIDIPYDDRRVKFYPAVRPHDDGGFLSSGYHGCFRSHLGILRHALDAGLSTILAAEDDLHFTRAYLDHEEHVVERLRELNWDVVFLGTQRDSYRGTTPHLAPCDDSVIGTHLYGVHRRALTRLTDFMEELLSRPPGHLDGGPMSPDGALKFFAARNDDIKAYVVRPTLAIQRASRNDIHTPRWFDHVPLLASVVRFGRSVKNQLPRR